MNNPISKTLGNVIKARAKWYADGQGGYAKEWLTDAEEDVKSVLRAFLASPEMDKVIEALSLYKIIDDGAYVLLKGFAAKDTDSDPNSPAGQALTTLQAIQKEVGE